MKNVLVIMGLTALLLASGAKAQDITISWQVTGKKITGCYPSAHWRFTETPHPN
jgi:hypothetical protein